MGSEPERKKALLTLHAATVSLNKAERKRQWKQSSHLMLTNDEVQKFIGAANRRYQITWSGLSLDPNWQEERYDGSIEKMVSSQIRGMRMLGMPLTLPLRSDTTQEELDIVAATLTRHGINPDHLLNQFRIVKATEEAFRKDVLDKMKAAREKGNFECGRVLKTMKRTSDHLLRITYGGDQILETTTNHPFFSISKARYVPAGELTLGEELLHFTGETIKIEKLKMRFGSFPVYNLDAEGNHNYFAGGVLVHNCNMAIAGTVAAGAGVVADAAVGGAAAAAIGAAAVPAAVIGSAAVLGYALHKATKPADNAGEGSLTAAPSATTGQPEGIGATLTGYIKDSSIGKFVGNLFRDNTGETSEGASAAPSSDTKGKGKVAESAGEKEDKRFTEEQQALVDMAKQDKRKGITEDDMEAYKDLNKELGKKGFTDEDAVRGPEEHPNRPFGKNKHGHVGPVDHIPIN